eukprot:g27895.t1
MFLENVLLAPLSTPESGMTFVAAYDACVFPAPHSWKVLYKIAQGTRVTVAGTPKSCDGDIMVPIQPKGWIDIVDLTITRPRPEPKPKSKTGPQRDSPDLLRRASKLAQDIGDTAQEYVKTGYDGSAQAAGMTPEILKQAVLARFQYWQQAVNDATLLGKVAFVGKDWFSGPSAYNAPLTEEIQRAAHSMGLGSRTGGLEVFTAPFVRAIRKAESTSYAYWDDYFVGYDSSNGFLDLRDEGEEFTPRLADRFLGGRRTDLAAGVRSFVFQLLPTRTEPGQVGAGFFDAAQPSAQLGNNVCVFVSFGIPSSSNAADCRFRLRVGLSEIGSVSACSGGSFAPDTVTHNDLEPLLQTARFNFSSSLVTQSEFTIELDPAATKDMVIKMVRVVRACNAGSTADSTTLLTTTQQPVTSTEATTTFATTREPTSTSTETFDTSAASSTTITLTTVLAITTAAVSTTSSSDASTTPACTTSLHPVADAYVRGGSYADRAFGSEDPEKLIVKGANREKWSRRGFLRFDLESASEPVSATLQERVFRHQSPSEISEESDDKITILTMMGFGHEAAEASLKRCSSIEAAVEYIMENATLKGGSARDHPVLPLQAAGKTFTRDTSTLSEQPGQGRRRSQTVQADLMRCGYSEAQAKAAARRCSSIEAAVEWIAQHPDVVT